MAEAYPHCWLVAAAVTGDRVEADDIVQEASLIALSKLTDFTAGSNFTAWMSQIVRLTALNHLRKSVRRGSVVTDPATIDKAVAAAANGPEGFASVTAAGQLAANQADFDDETLLALAEVGDEARACLLLRTVRRLSYTEIAHTLRIPEGTAMSHVHRAKQSMRQRLKDRQQNSVRLVKE
jgi:RNA polymerase sigma-70 factor (ECF subfamily)